MPAQVANLPAGHCKSGRKSFQDANAAGALQCSRCGCPDRVDGRELAERQRQFAQGQPYDGAHKGPVRSRIEGRRVDGSNTVPLIDLLRAALGSVGFALALFNLFTQGHAKVFLSHSDPRVVVTQPWAFEVGCGGVFSHAPWVGSAGQSL